MSGRAAPANKTGLASGEPATALVRADASQPVDVQALVPLALEILARAGVTIVQAAAPAQAAKLLDADGVASALGRSPGTIYRLAKKRLIPSVRIGRCLMFELDAVINALRVPVRAELPSAPPAAPGRGDRCERARAARRRDAASAPGARSTRAGANDHEARLRAAAEATKALGK